MDGQIFNARTILNNGYTMKTLLDVYLRRIPHDIVTAQYHGVLPPCSAHFHTIPNTDTKLYVAGSSTYYVRYNNMVERINLCPM